MSANPFFFTHVLKRVNQDCEDGDFLGSHAGDFDDPNVEEFSTLSLDALKYQALDNDFGTWPNTDHMPDILTQEPALEQSDNHNQENGPITEDDAATSPTSSEDVLIPPSPHPMTNPLPTIGLRAIGLCNAHWSLNLVASIAGSFSCRLNYCIIPMTTPLQQSTV